MAERPRESLAGIVGVLGGLYGAKKLANIESGFSQFSSDISRIGDQITTSINYQTSLQHAGFKSLIELQAGTMFALNKVNNSIQKVEIELSKINNILERREKREEKVGDFRLIIIDIEETLDYIDTIKHHYTPWAAFQTRVLQDIIVEREIKISDFKLLPTNEVKDIKAILKRVDTTYRECLSLMEEKS